MTTASDASDDVRGTPASPPGPLSRWASRWSRRLLDAALEAGLDLEDARRVMDPLIYGRVADGGAPRDRVYALVQELLKHGVEGADAPLRKVVEHFVRLRPEADRLRRVGLELQGRSTAAQLGEALARVPHELVRAGAEGRLVIVVGPELGALSLADMQTRLFERLGAPEEPWRGERGGANNFLRRKFSSAQRQVALRAVLDEVALGALAPNEALVALAQVAHATVVTVNTDRLVERALGEGAEVVLVRDFTLASSGERLFKTRGDLGVPDSVHDLPGGPWLVVPAGAGAWEDTLRKWIQTRAWLFLGFDNPEAEEALEELRRLQPEGEPPVWVVPWDVERAEGLSTDRVIALKQREHTLAWFGRLADRIELEGTRARLATVEHQRDAYATQVEEGLRERRHLARAASNEGRHEDARIAFDALLEDAERRVAEDPSQRWRGWRMQCRVDVAVALLNLQEHGALQRAIDAWEDAELVVAPTGVRAIAAEILAMRGEVERARSLLPVDDGDADVRRARWRITLRAGDMPEGEAPEDPFVQLDLAMHWLGAGRLDRVVELALPHVESTHPDVALMAASFVAAALQQTIFDDLSAAEPIAEDPALRGRCVDAVDRTFRRLRVGPKRHLAFQRTLLANFVMWAELALHPSVAKDALRALRRIATDEEISFESEREALEATARALRDEGDLLALERLRKTGRPWLDEHYRVAVLVLAGRREEATRRAQAAVREHPRRPLLDGVLGQLLLGEGQVEEAVEAAQRAFDLFPSKVHRALLGKALRDARRAAEAWLQVEPLGDEPVLDWRWLRASVASAVQPDVAVDAWDACQELDPTDLTLRWNRAVACFHQGDHERAAEVMWEVVDLPGRRALTVEDIVRIEQFARVGRPETIQVRLKRLARLLEEGFADDPDAEAARLALLVHLHFPDGHRPVRYDLLKEAGKLEAVSPVEATARARQIGEWRGAIESLYLRGGLDFASLCSIQGARAPRVVVGMLDDLEETSRRLNAPVRMVPRRTASTWSGARVLVSELELDLLERLDLLRPFADLLGPDGAMVLFEDVHQSLSESVVWLQRERKDDALRAHTAFEEALRRHEIGSVGLDSASDQHVLIVSARNAEQTGAVLVHSVIERLRPELTEDERRRLSARFPAKEAGVIVDLPRRAWADDDVLRAFHEAGVLPVLRGLFPEGLHLSPEGVRQLREERLIATRSVEAAKLAERVHRTVGALRVERRVEFDLRPHVDLPEVAARDDFERMEAVARAPLRNALSWRAAMVGNQRQLLTLDGFVANPLASVDAFRALHWDSIEALQATMDLVRKTDDRVVDLCELLPLLVTSEREFELRIDLACMGVQGALLPDTIAELARRFGRLDNARVRRVLDAIERATRPDNEGVAHTNAMGARFLLVERYARAAEAIAATLSDEATRSDVLTQLFDRVEALDGAVGNTLLACFVWAIGLGAMGHLSQWLEAFEGGGVTFKEDSPSGRVFAVMNRWRRGVARRSRGFLRGFRSALLYLEERTTDEPSELVVHVTVYLLGGTVPRGNIFPLRDAGVGTLATLSGAWRHRPLASLALKLEDVRTGEHHHVMAEEALQNVAQRMCDGVDVLRLAPGAVHVLYPLPNAMGALRVLALPEALFLRALPDRVRSHAFGLAIAVSSIDGRHCDALLAFAEAPGDAIGRRALALTAASTPWRLVTEVPEAFHSWAARDAWLDVGLPKDLDELRALLSEPPGPLPEEHLPALINARWAESGPWRARPAPAELAEVACAMPGDLAVLLAGIRRQSGVLPQRVGEALRRLERPDEQPVGQLCADLVFLAWTARKEGFVTIGDSSIDLRERLPSLWLRSLNASLSGQEVSSSEDSPTWTPEVAPVAASLARHERALLLLCRGVVQARATPPLLRRDGLWLTWRLYGWMAELVGRMEPSTRHPWIEAVARGSVVAFVAPPDTDRLDPATFDGWPHRLAALLYALLLDDEVAHELPEDTAATPAVVSNELVTLLVGLASRDMTEDERSRRTNAFDASILGWRGPTTIPELALRALLSLDRMAFPRIPAARRLRWVIDLSQRPAMHPTLHERLVAAVILTLQDLSRAEQLAFGEWLDRLEPADMRERAWRSFGLVKLVAAGHHERTTALRDELHAHPTEPPAAEIFGVLLDAVTRDAVDALAQEVEAMLQAATAQGADPIPFALAATRLVLEGTPTQVGAAKVWLAGLRTRYRDDARVKTALAALGIM